MASRLLVEELARRLFNETDADRSGDLSLEEMIKAHAYSLNEQDPLSRHTMGISFKDMDANSDARLEFSEYLHRWPTDDEDHSKKLPHLFQCAQWALVGECKASIEFMSHKCPTPCKHWAHYVQQCINWAREGECHANPETMNSICSRFCSGQAASHFHSSLAGLALEHQANPVLLHKWLASDFFVASCAILWQPRPCGRWQSNRLRCKRTATGDNTPWDWEWHSFVQLAIQSMPCL